MDTLAKPLVGAKLLVFLLSNRSLCFPTEVKFPLVSSFVRCSAASAMIVNATVAEWTPPAPPAVAKALVMVLVGFGVVGAAIWRPPAMVGVVDLSFVGLKMARKER
eukprot:scaffold22644_cov44-Cyclotella_meneghiniana.AAC.9